MGLRSASASSGANVGTSEYRLFSSSRIAHAGSGSALVMSWARSLADKSAGYSSSRYCWSSVIKRSPLVSGCHLRTPRGVPRLHLSSDIAVKVSHMHVRGAPDTTDGQLPRVHPLTDESARFPQVAPCFCVGEQRRIDSRCVGAFM